jgi:aminomethyltransferase
MAPFAGWDMPIQYDGIVAEHLRCRSAAVIFDVSHMGEFEIAGPGAGDALQRVLTQDIAALGPGQGRYGYLLREDGGVLDDLVCARLGPDRFFLVVNAGTKQADADWIRARLGPGITLDDLSPRTAKLDIQGPQSRAALESALGARVPDLGYFRLTDLELLGTPCRLSRSGYTGEWGYELYVPAAEAERFWTALTAAGTITPAGLGARDTLRLEVAYPLYGHELSVDRTPVAAARGGFLALERDFIGRDACRRDLERGCPRYLAGLRLESRRAARAGDAVFAGPAKIGEVTSGSLAPSLGVAVALAYVDAAHAAPGTKLDIEAHGRRLPAAVVETPFYCDGTARRKSAP